jgi:flagellar biosynthesis GTPase FlhF
MSRYYSYEEDEAFRQGERDAKYGRRNYDYDRYSDRERDRAYFDGYREEKRRQEERREERRQEELAEERAMQRRAEERKMEQQQIEEQMWADQQQEIEDDRVERLPNEPPSEETTSV